MKTHSAPNMVNPSTDAMMEKVHSRYTLVVLAAKRARQLLDGNPLRVNMKSTKNVTNALEEIVEGQIYFKRTKAGIK